MFRGTAIHIIETQVPSLMKQIKYKVHQQTTIMVENTCH